MTKDGISYQELYELVDKRTGDIMKKFEGLEDRVSILENFKTQLLLIGSLVVLFTNLFADWIKDKLGLR
jgi:hypothetical protein